MIKICSCHCFIKLSTTADLLLHHRCTFFVLSLNLFKEGRVRLLFPPEVWVPGHEVHCEGQWLAALFRLIDRNIGAASTWITLYVFLGYGEFHDNLSMFTGSKSLKCNLESFKLVTQCLNEFLNVSISYTIFQLVTQTFN